MGRRRTDGKQPRDDAKHLQGSEVLVEGTGIGLTIVRKAVERMGRAVGLESNPGKGSRFWIELREAA